MIGDIVPCSNWYHGDDCEALVCEAGWLLRGEYIHVGCWMCEGTKLVRIVEERMDYRRVEPYGKAVAS